MGGEVRRGETGDVHEIIRTYASYRGQLGNHSKMDESLIPSALRRARIGRELTLEGMSSRSGLSAQHISKIETGKGRRTGLGTIERLAESLNMTLMLIPDHLAADVRTYIQSRGRTFGSPVPPTKEDSI